MGKIQLSVTVENGKGSFGAQMDKANLVELTLASAKLDILKAKMTQQIEKAMNAQSDIRFEK